MNESEQRIAIAEACGWAHPTDCARENPHKWKSPLDGCCYDGVPDYLNDLNAMHEAEKSLTELEKIEFAEHLAQALKFDDDYYEGWDVGLADFFSLAHATAPQHAAAFLYAIRSRKKK